ncbi:MAG: hypothetical protein IT514_04660, partial [Burkholderiales bacterium]|nr:hypothetical protein [Burkholderiales bacterium]
MRTADSGRAGARFALVAAAAFAAPRFATAILALTFLALTFLALAFLAPALLGAVRAAAAFFANTPLVAPRFVSLAISRPPP